MDADVMTQQWLATEYETVLAGLVLSVKKKRFVPHISPSDLEKEEDQRQAAALVMEIKDKHIPMIESRCREELNSVCDKMPASVLSKCFATIEMTWLKENYFKIVEMVIQEAVDAAAFEFRSEVDPESLDTEEEKTNARTLIRHVRAEHETLIKSEVRKALDSVMRALPPSVIKGMEQIIESKWKKEKYFNVVATVLKVPVIESPTAGSGSRQEEVLETSIGQPSSSVAWFLQRSRQKRARMERPEASLKKVTEIHASAKSGEMCHLDGLLVVSAGTSRSSQVKNTRTEELEARAIFNFGVADESGAIKVTFWCGLSEDGVTDIDGAIQAADGGKCARILLCDVIVRAPRNTALECVNEVHSNETTKYTLSAGASLTMVPDMRIIVEDFRKFKRALPFFSCMKPVIVGEVTAGGTLKGTEQVAFKLMDRQRCAVDCIAHGESTPIDLYNKGAEIVIYNAVVQGGYRKSPGALWIFADSYVVCLKSTNLIELPTEDVILQ
jgi:hypothetical protein